mgnify:FL=1
MNEKKRSLFPIHPATRAFYREGRRTPGYTVVDFLHGYLYGRWPYFYLGLGLSNRPLFRVLRPLAMGIGRLLGLWSAEGTAAGKKSRTFADTYHGKVLPLEGATRLISVGEDVRLTDLEHVIPYATARDIILQHPDHIVALECPCRANREHPCLPLDVCLAVGEPFASFTLAHHPRRSRRLSVAEAAAVLKAEHERGHVHHAFFKDAMLGRFYAICNCCSCCCGAMEAHRSGTPMLAASGYVCQVDGERCLGCWVCVEACPFQALTLEENRASVDPDRCMGCGVCRDRCPEGALALVRDPMHGEPLEIEQRLHERHGVGGAS